MDSPHLDVNGDELRIGDKVYYLDYIGEPVAEIYGFSGPDGDVDDEGRNYGIPSHVMIRFEDGEELAVPTTSSARGWWDDDAPWLCGELRKVVET